MYAAPSSARSGTGGDQRAKTAKVKISDLACDVCFCAQLMERATGIEPAWPAWKFSNPPLGRPADR